MEHFRVMPDPRPERAHITVEADGDHMPAVKGNSAGREQAVRQVLGGPSRRARRSQPAVGIAPHQGASSRRDPTARAGEPATP